MALGDGGRGAATVSRHRLSPSGSDQTPATLGSSTLPPGDLGKSPVPQTGTFLSYNRR